MTITQSQPERRGKIIAKQKGRFLIRRFAQAAVHFTWREPDVRQRAQSCLNRQSETRLLRNVSQCALADAGDTVFDHGSVWLAHCVRFMTDG